VRWHPDVQRLMRMANNIGAWSNDLFTLEKELRHGDPHMETDCLAGPRLSVKIFFSRGGSWRFFSPLGLNGDNR
jgi:hypothetical protein